LEDTNSYTQVNLSFLTTDPLIFFNALNIFSSIFFQLIVISNLITGH
jgi:hypothetical protein